MAGPRPRGRFAGQGLSPLTAYLPIDMVGPGLGLGLVFVGGHRYSAVDRNAGLAF